MSKDDDFYKKTLGPLFQEDALDGGRIHTRICRKCEYPNLYAKGKHPRYCEKCKTKLEDK